LPPTTPASSNRRIAKNTVILYLRQLVTVGISLYTVRVVLNTLGVEDFGLYNLVGGIVAMLSFLPSAMASATQRYFSYALGQEDREGLRKIFSVNFIIYASLAALALVILITAGTWFVTDYVKIRPDRLNAALSLYHISIWTFTLGILTAPFQAIITAHEDFSVFAGISIADACSKLGAVLLLPILTGEKLVLYGTLLLAVSILVGGIYLIVCLYRYPECQFRRFHWDSLLFREIIGFTGWTLFGQLTTVARNQAVTILLNQAFNPVTVAARAIALTIAGQATSLSTNFNTSLYPPIIKAYAAGERDRMYALIYNGSKVTFSLMWILALPLLLQMDTILTIWLKQPPAGAVLFTQLAIAETIINALALPLMTAARAPGRMAMYESVLGAIQFAIFFSSWFVLWLGAPAYSVFIVAIVANLIMFVVRLIIVHRLIAIPVGGFLRNVAGPVLGIVFTSAAPAIVFRHFSTGGILSNTISTVASGLWAVACVYQLGFSQEARAKGRELILIKIKRLRSPNRYITR